MSIDHNTWQVAKGLVAVALKRHSTDNISVVVIDFKSIDYWNQKGSGDKNNWLGGLFKRS